MTGHFDMWLEREHGQPLWRQHSIPIRKTGLFALSIGLWANRRQCASRPRSASGKAQRFGRRCYSRPKPRGRRKTPHSRCWALPKTKAKKSQEGRHLPNKRLDASNKRRKVSAPCDGIGGEVSVLECMTVILWSARGPCLHASGSARSSSRAIGIASRPASGQGNAGSDAWAICFAWGCLRICLMPSPRMLHGIVLKSTSRQGRLAIMGAKRTRFDSGRQPCHRTKSATWCAAWSACFQVMVAGDNSQAFERYHLSE